MICADKSFFRDFEGAALCGALFEGTPYHARRIHPLRPQVCGKLSALIQNGDFGTRLKLFKYLREKAKTTLFAFSLNLPMPWLTGTG